MRTPSLHEFLLACLLQLPLLLFVFRAPFLSGNIPYYGAGDSPSRLIESVTEDHLLLADYYAVARDLKSGLFPAWHPSGEAGTPLLGKTSEGLFSPLHIPLYLLPLSSFPHTMVFVVVLRLFFAFAFTYLYTRSLNIPPAGAFLAGNLFSFHWVTFVAAHYSAMGSGLYLPLLLLLVEFYFQKPQHRTAIFFLPWAMALPFWAGHFENSLRVCALTAAYFSIRLIQQEAPTLKNILQHAGIFFLLALIGAGLSAAQLVSGWEYIQWSFNKVWRSLPEFEWRFRIVSKRLGPEDVPYLFGGIIGLSIFAFMLRRTLARKPLTARGALPAVAGAAFGLAFGIAFLANVGLDDSLRIFAFRRDLSSPVAWLPGLYILILSLWGWTISYDVAASRAIGWLLAIGILVALKTPPAANVLSHMPIIKLTNGSTYHYEIALGMAVLCASALSRIYDSRGDRTSDRAERAKPLLLVLGTVVIGFCLSQYLKGNLAEFVPDSAQEAGKTGHFGGFMGPERVHSTSNFHTLDGWVSAEKPIKSISIGIQHPQKGRRSFSARTRQSKWWRERIYFEGRVEIPIEAVPFRALVEVEHEDGSRRFIGGPLIEWMSRGPEPWTTYLLIVGVLFAPLLILYPKALAPLAYGGLILCCAWMGNTLISTPPLRPFPHPLAGIAKMKEEKGLYRIFSPNKEFLVPDYSSIYSLDDIRMCGDNLNILGTRYFNMMVGSLLDGEPQARESALRLLGIANVRYWLNSPSAQHAHPDLIPFYDGKDMRIHQNRHFMPRARFFDSYLVLDIAGWREWSKGTGIMAPLMSALSTGQLDPSKTLVLNDTPVWTKQAGFESPRSSAPDVQVLEYFPHRVVLQVDTPRKGFVFLSDAFFPGWHAYINGRPTQILRSWIAFRSVPVEPGRFVLEFRYEPLALRMALLLGLLIVIAWLLLYVKSLISDRRLKLDENRPCPVEVLLLILLIPWFLFWASWWIFFFRGGV